MTEKGFEEEEEERRRERETFVWYIQAQIREKQYISKELLTQSLQSDCHCQRSGGETIKTGTPAPKALPKTFWLVDCKEEGWKKKAKSQLTSQGITACKFVRAQHIPTGF